MSAKLHLDPNDLAELIADSVREVLAARQVGFFRLPHVVCDQVAGEDLDMLCREIGLNTAACAAAIDSNPENE